MMDTIQKIKYSFYLLCTLLLFSCQKSNQVYYDGLPQIQFTTSHLEVALTPEVQQIQFDVELVAGIPSGDIPFHLEMTSDEITPDLIDFARSYKVKKGDFRTTISIPLDYKKLKKESRWAFQLVMDSPSYQVAHRSQFELNITPYDWIQSLAGKYQLSFTDHYKKTYQYAVDVVYHEVNGKRVVSITEIPVWSFYSGPKKSPIPLDFELVDNGTPTVSLMKDVFTLGTYATYQKWFLRRDYGAFNFEATTDGDCFYEIEKSKFHLSYRTSLERGKSYEMKEVTLSKIE